MQQSLNTVKCVYRKPMMLHDGNSNFKHKIYVISIMNYYGIISIMALNELIALGDKLRMHRYFQIKALTISSAVQQVFNTWYIPGINTVLVLNVYYC